MPPAPLPRSLYAETATPAIEAPPLYGEKQVPVAIIGGGFTGLSTALHLAERGIVATVIEANEPGWGASGRNGGQVNPGLKPDPDEVEHDHGAEMGGRMIAFSYGAPDLVFDLIRRHGIDCAASQTGTLRAGIRASNAQAAENLFAQCSRRGMPVRYLDAAACAEATGTTRYAGALLDPRGGHLNPLSYARGLARTAQRLGASIHGATPALSLTRHAARWRISTPKGSLIAERVVIGTNGYTDGLWPRLRQTVVPVFSTILATEPLPEEVQRQILPLRSAVYETGHITVYYRLDDAGRLLMGGRGPQNPADGPSMAPYLRDYAERLWPVLKGYGWTHGWNGQVAVTKDHYPHLHAPEPGLLMSLGYNGRGVAMATAMGSLLARHIAGEPLDSLPMPLSPIRPMPFHRFWKIGVTVAVAQRRLRDRFGL
ncbi:FAD-binding oxidoreductase [Acetobacteraceae bacterium H6797]|nr:FAD-binding oxidoreductase [Acetobacteraceae bacterium H6797]